MLFVTGSNIYFLDGIENRFRKRDFSKEVAKRVYQLL